MQAALRHTFLATYMPCSRRHRCSQSVHWGSQQPTWQLMKPGHHPTPRRAPAGTNMTVHVTTMHVNVGCRCRCWQLLTVHYIVPVARCAKPFKWPHDSCHYNYGCELQLGGLLWHPLGHASRYRLAAGDEQTPKLVHWLTIMAVFRFEKVMAGQGSYFMKACCIMTFL